MAILSECPVCHSKDLEQHLIPDKVIYQRGTLVGPRPDGCHCTNCGIRFVFNVAGECSACRGSGSIASRTEAKSVDCYECGGKGFMS